MQSKTLYFDHATATRPSEQALGRMVSIMTDQWASPAAPHRFGQRQRAAIAEGYQGLYDLLGAKPDATILLTSSGAEAVNHVIQGVHLDISRVTGKNQIITGAADEAPAIMALARQERLGCVAKTASCDSQGRVTAAAVADVLSPRTALVSLSWANGLTGVINPVAEIAQLCHERGVLLHLEATHVLGKLAFDLDDIGADFISFNGDQIHAPKGTGALYMRPGLKLSPLIAGDMSQGGLRGGDLNVPLLVGLGVACREALDSRDFLCTEVARLRNKLEEGIISKNPKAHVLFRGQARVPHISAIAFPGIVSEALMFALNHQGLCCCMGGGTFQQIDLVLQAAGVPAYQAHTALSFALARTTTEDEVDRAIAIINAAVAKYGKLSMGLLEVHA